MLKEFSHKLYGKVRTNIIDGKPYLNYIDVAEVFKIKNKNNLRAKLSGDFFRKLPENIEGKTTNVYYISFECLKLILCNSRLAEADEVFAWLINVVKENVVKLSKRNEELLELANDKNITKEQAELMFENRRLKLKIEQYKEIQEALKIVLGNQETFLLEKVRTKLKLTKLTDDLFFKVLREEGILDLNNIATQEYCDKEMFRVLDINTKTKSKNINLEITVVYKKGIKHLERIFKKYVWKWWTNK